LDDEKIITPKVIFYSYGILGLISTASGFFSYFLVMKIYGFPFNILFGITKANAYNPENSPNYNNGIRFDDIVSVNSSNPFG
jgi:hypothetical protein